MTSLPNPHYLSLTCKSSLKLYIFLQGFEYTDEEGNVFRGNWTVFEPHGIDPPACQESPYTRINHLGNIEGGYPAVYNWTLPPNVEHERCVVRIR